MERLGESLMLEFRAAVLDYWHRVSILVCLTDRETGRIAQVAKPIQMIMEPYQQGITIGTWEMDIEAAIRLMDALWKAGVRPHEFQNPSGEINRLEAHLSDMRKLVFQGRGGVVREGTPVSSETEGG